MHGQLVSTAPWGMAGSYLVQWEGSSKDILAQQPVHPHLLLPRVAILCFSQDLVELRGQHQER